MKNDSDLQVDDVQNPINGNPYLDTAEIEVTTKR
jgi:hypothetical protein